MTDRFVPLSFQALAALVFGELRDKGSILGLPRELFFLPSPAHRFRTRIYDQPLETPLGVAAGPHSQLAPNIVVAWLCGARFIELKTVQTLDRLEITKPCIDMRDEGYNVEWSQELTIPESFDEYLRAWVLIHALHRRLGFPGREPGVVFNLSVGYDLAGLQKPNMQRFLERVRDAGELLERHVATVARHFPEVAEIEIPARLSDNVTLSTMHGCPPEEIGRIAAYLMETWGLHTSVKLNPTLLGAETVRGILNERLGWRLAVPDRAFEHDITWDGAVQLLAELEATAKRRGVTFGVKLSNTLEVEHDGRVFDPKEAAMYLSGRPLHALTVELANRLAGQLGGRLPVSFAGGADAFNVPHLLAAGMATVTSCSDLLRPGGYTRLLQYLETTGAAMVAVGADDLPSFICRTAAEREPDNAAQALPPAERVRACAALNLAHYATAALDDPAYRQGTFERRHAKSDRKLGRFDCILAPCTDGCAVDQKVPQYMRLVAAGRPDLAAAVIRDDNPMAAVLGHACTHACELLCLRTHYDQPLAIREVKRFAMGHEPAPAPPTTARQHARVAVIGAGPCGIAVAFHLGRAGYPVTLVDERASAGGMVAATIPAFRSAGEVLEQDFRQLASLGVELTSGVRVGRDVTLAQLRQRGFAYIVLAAGAQRGLPLGIEGEQTAGVLDGLELLRSVRCGDPPALSGRVGVVGGGDVAMDCARTVLRLGAASVTVLYRRTREQMPAQREEVEAALGEGVELQELVAPERVEDLGGRLRALSCSRMRLGEPDASGRPRPEMVPDSEHSVPLDWLVVAIGQRADLGFLGNEHVELTSQGYVRVDPRTMETSLPGVFAGGDLVMDGPATIVAAAGDGRRIAEAIREREEGARPAAAAPPTAGETTELLRRRSRRLARVAVPQLPADQRRDFVEVIGTLDAEAARKEAVRCLDCDLMCSTCITVCPNRALFTYRAQPLTLTLPRLRVQGGRLRPLADERLQLAQGLQVALLADLCNGCGNCATFCPTADRPYRDKPRLFLTREPFEAESDNAFLLAPPAMILGRFGGATHTLVAGTQLRYTSNQLEVTLERDCHAVLEARLSGEVPDRVELSLLPCATLYALLASIGSSMPELPAGRA